MSGKQLGECVGAARRGRSVLLLWKHGHRESSTRVRASAASDVYKRQVGGEPAYASYIFKKSGDALLKVVRRS